MLKIESNGSRWAGEAPATISELLEVMAREPLCPSFLDLGGEPFEGAARVGVRNPDWNHGSPSSVPQWIDGPPIYDEHPEAIRFFGNFAELSHVFCIDTDEPAVVAQLRGAIASNMASSAFKRVQAGRKRRAA